MSRRHRCSPPPALALNVTIPSDDRFVDLAGILTVRVAKFVGFGEDEAERLGTAVDRVAAGVVEHAFAGDRCRSLDISYWTTEHDIEIDLRYRRAARHVDAVGRRFAAAGLDLPATDVVRQAVKVEFGCDNGVDFCRLTRALPSEAS
ncbi:MAG: hypothetical protein HYX76_11525 [Acidobacteria bacterium]|nr:hypothetical protein [Acidobacteriota bacterium]